MVIENGSRIGRSAAREVQAPRSIRVFRRTGEYESLGFQLGLDFVRNPFVGGDDENSVISVLDRGDDIVKNIRVHLGCPCLV